MSNERAAEASVRPTPWGPLHASKGRKRSLCTKRTSFSVSLSRGEAGADGRVVTTVRAEKLDAPAHAETTSDRSPDPLVPRSSGPLMICLFSLQASITPRAGLLPVSIFLYEVHPVVREIACGTDEV
ncbi:hypothetical protein D623_10017970 [Myotis brandtii]|uniref:Uncharacterized protein n=1 Tax=Myotis brandtii TaxID=109478 RepID=S7ML39_MYOBR|nr:hypothetical protein D623_10017970 [Myotis brandtii]